MHPSLPRILSGFAVSILGGQLVIWPLTEKLLWPRIAKVHGKSDISKPALSWLVGCIERLLYTAALIVGIWQWLGIWLAVKAVARWQNAKSISAEPDTDNIWLIGNALSVLFGYLGAFVALGCIPPLMKS